MILIQLEDGCARVLRRRGQRAVAVGRSGATRGENVDGQRQADGAIEGVRGARGCSPASWRSSSRCCRWRRARSRPTTRTCRGGSGASPTSAASSCSSPQDRPEEWSPIGINYPVTSGDNLWVGAEGRAEIDYGAGQFRLAGDTSVHVSRLDDRQLALFVAQGRVIVRVRFLDRDEVATVDTPNTQVQLTRPGPLPDRGEPGPHGDHGRRPRGRGAGRHRRRRPAGAPRADRDGERRGPGVRRRAQRIRHRRLRRVERRPRPPLRAQPLGELRLAADGRAGRSSTATARGTRTPPTAPSGIPTAVAVDWAPYRFGRWAHVGRWGWTWIDDAPWGYAPFHYGRWVWVGGRWGWSPGAYVARPVWAPALVGWVGGSGWAMAVTAGGPGLRLGAAGLGRRRTSRGGAGRLRPALLVVLQPSLRGAVRGQPRRAADVPVAYSNGRVPGAVSAVAGATLAAQRPVAIEPRRAAGRRRRTRR